MRPFGFSNIAVILAYLGTSGDERRRRPLAAQRHRHRRGLGQVPVDVPPPGYVFSIWGVIYLGLAVYAVAQALPALRRRPAVGAAAWPFVLSSLLNAAWLVTWHWLYIRLGAEVLSLIVPVTRLICN
ncbi:MAG: hypothetical protein M5U09_23175, partial [Gammaproteobacteria bacterium]|nr:hypothetical protein [Gammaproteobacteria bacterium]